MIRAPAGGGVTVLLTTRYLGEPDALAGHIGVIDGLPFVFVPG